MFHGFGSDIYLPRFSPSSDRWLSGKEKETRYLLDRGLEACDINRYIIIYCRVSKTEITDPQVFLFLSVDKTFWIYSLVMFPNTWTSCEFLGLIFMAFGPSYSYSLIRLLYGEKWSDGEASLALQFYCLYIIVLAMNG